MSFRDYPSVEYVRSLLRYKDGRLFWLPRPREWFPNEGTWISWNNRCANNEAGGLNKQDPPRWTTSINNISITRYHIVWALHHGEWVQQIDHINRNQIDDRIENLREATSSLNNVNRGITGRNKSGYVGAYWSKKDQTWFTQIAIKGKPWKKRYIGSYKTPEEAHAAYVKATREEWGQYDP